MTQKQLSNLLSITITIFLVAFFIFTNHSQVKAGTEHNIRGKAYIPGSSLSFDGISTRVSINYTNPVTQTSVVAWFKKNGVPAGDHHIITGGQSVEISIHSSGYIRTGVTTNTQGRKVFNSGSGLTDGNWHQVAMTYDGTNLRSFIDGVQTAINPVSGNLTGIAQEIGRYLSNSYAANGLIDDVRIYNRALSADEVSRLYQGIDISSGVVGHWRFDEADGLVANDSSGNDNHGTLVNGPAWSTDVPNLNNKKYAYFNCIDEDTGRFPFTFPFYFSVDPCSLTYAGHDLGTGGYGVSINDDYIFSGYAREETGTTGLISFQHGIPDGESYDTLYNNCPTVKIDNCDADNYCSACYNETTQRVFGWAKVIDDDSYITLHDDLNTDGVGIYNYAAPNPGHFFGYGDHDSWGQISFNCLNEGPSCDPNNIYKVYRWDLKLRQMSAPHLSYAQACTHGALRTTFEWQLISGNQTHYEIKLNTENNPDTAISTTKTFGSVNQLICPGLSCPPLVSNLLNYKTSYYWWLKIYDDDNALFTDWIQFNHSPNNIGVLTDNNDYNNSVSLNPTLTFTTYRHEFPSPFFTWYPEDIIAGTSTDFMASSSSHYHGESNPTQEIPCYTDACLADFEWSSNSGAIISSTSTATTSIIFTKIIPNQTISLKLSDPTGYYCSYTAVMTKINYNLPLWREVKP